MSECSEGHEFQWDYQESDPKRPGIEIATVISKSCSCAIDWRTAMLERIE